MVSEYKGDFAGVKVLYLLSQSDLPQTPWDIVCMLEIDGDERDNIINASHTLRKLHETGLVERRRSDKSQKPYEYWIADSWEPAD